MRAQTLLQRPIHLTGSGSTLFTLCTSGAQATALADQATSKLADQCAAIPTQIGSMTR